MYKICIAIVAMLAVAAAKPSLGYSFGTPFSQAYSVAPVAPVASAYSAYPAPAVYSAPSIYSTPYLGNYAAHYAAPASYVAAAPLIAEPYSAYPYSYAHNYASPLEYGYGELPLWKKK